MSGFCGALRLFVQETAVQDRGHASPSEAVLKTGMDDQEENGQWR